jgi:hypothetical protein
MGQDAVDARGNLIAEIFLGIPHAIQVNLDTGQWKRFSTRIDILGVDLPFDSKALEAAILETLETGSVEAP